MKKLNRGVAIVGTGMSRFGAFADKTTRDLFVEAYRDMSDSVDKGFDPKDVEAVYIGNFNNELFEGQGHTAPIMADWAGLVPSAATRVEDACASSGVALRHGSGPAGGTERHRCCHLRMDLPARPYRTDGGVAGRGRGGRRGALRP